MVDSFVFSIGSKNTFIVLNVTSSRLTRVVDEASSWFHVALLLQSERLHSLHNTNLDLVANALEQKLPLKGDHFAFLGCLERPDQCLVVIRNVVVVEELSKCRVWLAFYPDAPDIHQQLGTLFVQTAL